MSVYSGTDHVELEACVNSIFAQQLQPDEIVVVYDGPVSEKVKTYFTDTQATSDISICIY